MREEEDHFMILRSQFIRKTIILNVNVPKISTLKNGKQKDIHCLLKYIIAVVNFNTHRSIIHRTSRQKTSKDIKVNNVIKFELLDFFRILHAMTVE